MTRIILLLFLLIFPSSCVSIPQCESSPPLSLPFTTFDGLPDSSTTAKMCHDGTNLFVNWTCIDKQVLSNFDQCNDPLYKMDVVEIFIATQDSYPYNYFEIEVSPRGQLFIADIHNPNGYCYNLGTTYYACGFAQYGAKITDEGSEAWLIIGLEFLGRGRIQKNLKGNLYRIDVSTKDPTKYLTYQPTYATPPCFHRPSSFADFTLASSQTESDQA